MKLKTRLSRRQRTILLMLRCEYIDGSHKLTAKGRGFMSPWCWRRWNDLLCFISSAHKAEVLTVLTCIETIGRSK